ncbi:ankyrin repeat-containing domain protein [Triangularia verruculosa]|uniref:Ankyrin repeat-containing domain protein n=1 Tax=Triangularia verruculosa TaxID=2587418 RepID=A0AAN6XMN7_9PEZI|nr:ankyrin repeat-containing domain protein [Triangularia verruculosa]
MAPVQLSEEQIDDLIYLARVGEKDELSTFVSELIESSTSEPKPSAADILAAAVDDTKKNTCLHMASANGHVEIVEYILSQFTPAPKEQKQGFLDATNEFGNTGLHWAALNGHLPVVKLLVDNGASVALANDKNYIPLDLASFSEKIDVVDYFLKEVREMEAENAKEGLGEAVADVKMEDGEENEGPSKGKEKESS